MYYLLCRCCDCESVVLVVKCINTCVCRQPQLRMLNFIAMKGLKVFDI